MRGPRHVVGVIDDDSSVRGALTRLFRTAGFDVSAYGTAEEYLSRSDRGDVECLVIDVRLPGMSGLELLSQVRPAMPALLITAQEDTSVREKALAAGAAGFFLKPFDNRQLVSSVQHAIGMDVA
jgi:FixJ family two-component response regulator